MPLFPRTHQVIRVTPGAYVEGQWTPATEAAPVPVVLGIQPAKGEDVERIRVEKGTEGLAGLLVGYGSTAAPLKEGDVLIYDQARWICISAPPPRDTLGGATDHVKFMFTREVPPG